MQQQVPVRTSSSNAGRPMHAGPALLVLALAAAALAVPSQARAEFRPVWVGIGAVRFPGVAFDVVGALQIGTRLEGIVPDNGFDRAARASFAGNLACAGLHAAEVAVFFGAGFSSALGEDGASAAAGLIGSGLNLGVAVVGLTTGVDLLVRIKPAGLKGTDLGIGATWSGAVNVAMGGMGALWFVPLLVVGLIGADEVADDVEIGSVAPVSIRFEPTPSGLRLSGRW